MYNPHANPDYANEAALMSKGRLVKARLVDQDIPNVDWFWIQTGNCFVCKYFTAADADGRPKCLNKKISHSDFMNLYVHVNTCPQFEHGTSEQSNGLDVMKAAGIVEGEPSQEVEILVDEPWSISLAERAHREQSYFMDMAAQVDAGGGNSPLRGEYVDMTDDLERIDSNLSIEDQPRDEGGKWTKKNVAIIGLAANPPHAGHLALARHVRDTGGFDEVWMMPANKHVFKSDMAEPEHRLAMTRTMLEGEPGISVSDAEIRHDLPGPTIDTVAKLKEEYGDTHDFSWVVSQDEANTLDQWVRSDELKKDIPFVVTPRLGVEATPSADWSKEPPHRILGGGANLVDVSSTKLRKMLEDDEDTAEFLHPSVTTYIRNHELYKKKAALSVDTSGPPAQHAEIAPLFDDLKKQLAEFAEKKDDPAIAALKEEIRVLQETVRSIQNKPAPAIDPTMAVLVAELVKSNRPKRTITKVKKRNADNLIEEAEKTEEYLGDNE